MQRDRVGVVLPTQALGHAIYGVIAGVCDGNGLLQRFFQVLRVHVNHHVVRQVRSAGLYAIGFAVQCAGADACGFLDVVIALGVEICLVGRHAHIGVLQAQLGQQGSLHGHIERLAQALGAQVAKQADTRVGIDTLCARRVRGFPVLKIVEHGVGIVGGARKLQWQPAWGVGRQLQQADAVEGTALQRRKVLAGLVRQLEFAGGLGITAEGGGEGFAHRSDLEQRVLGNGLLPVLVCQAVVKVLHRTLIHYRYR